MRITITQHSLAPSPIPVQSCFFCGMSVSSEIARALYDAERGHLLGWSCTNCLDCTPEQLQQIAQVKAHALRAGAAKLSRQAERMSIEADALEHMAQMLLIAEDIRERGAAPLAST